MNGTGTTENSYRFAGEQFDSHVGQYYLRARYYDAGVGRFTGRDPFEGDMNVPLSLAKYPYVHGNPVNGVDPSGLYDESSVFATAVIQDVILRLAKYVVQKTIEFSLAKSAGRIIFAIVSSIFMVKAVEAQVSADAWDSNSGEDISRRYGVPVVVFGFNNLWEHAQHVRDAQSGWGYTTSRRQPLGQQRVPIKNAQPHPAINPVLHKGNDRYPDSWLSTLIPPGGKEIQEYMNREDSYFPEYTRSLPRGYARDEYPLATSQEGGKVNFDNNKVSVRLVHEIESSQQGPLVRDFYSAPDVQLDVGNLFVVLGSPGDSGWWTRKGEWMKYPK